MKNVWLVLMLISLGLGAAAQPKINKDAVKNLQPRTTVVRVLPVYPVSPYYGFNYGYGFRSPFYRPFYNSGFYQPRVIEYTPTELQLQIDDVENEFDYKISSIRRDKSIPGKERRQKIRDLRHQREDAIIEAKKSYFKKDNNSLSK
ncbi:MAG TPA: hypothetical protein VF622_17160 [Segetibacter sp.]|jgi:hypothetical protein